MITFLAFLIPSYSKAPHFISLFTLFLNTLLAVLPLKLFSKKDPFKIFGILLTIRLLIVASTLAFTYIRFNQNGIYFFLTCIVLFLLFQTIEIHFFLSDKKIFRKSQ